MPSLKDIRRRIVSIKNTQKITRAMKLVSAAKFARANSAIVAARPYAKSFAEMQNKILSAAQNVIESPLLAVQPEKRVLMVTVSTDRGFCGSLNSNLFKITQNFIRKKQKEGVDVHLLPWGKRARLFGKKYSLTQLNPREGILEKPTYQRAKELADELVSIYLKGEYDRIYISFVEFKSALAQQAKVVQLLPYLLPELDESAAVKAQDLILEPRLKEMLERLLRRSIIGTIYKILLEGAASEHGARMTAMDSATNNASEVLRKMNIQYARARQAAITKELIEITSGAQALGN
jgi:F-type H+-transporting ATPase subunit gamma